MEYKIIVISRHKAKGISTALIDSMLYPANEIITKAPAILTENPVFLSVTDMMLY